MAMGSRLGSVVAANINDLIGRSEDPTKMLNQAILEMSYRLTEARKQVVVAVADEKRFRLSWEKELNLSRKWKKKAMLAVRAGDDALAKEALYRRKEHEALSEELQRQWESHSKAVSELRLAFQTLNSKIEGAKRKKDLLLAKQRRAEATLLIQETLTSIRQDSAFETYDRIERRIEQIEAEAEAAFELNDQMTGDVLAQRFEQLEASSGMDMDLLELKEQMGMLPPARPQAFEVVEGGAAPREGLEDDLEEVLLAAPPRRLKARRAG